MNKRNYICWLFSLSPEIEMAEKQEFSMKASAHELTIDVATL